MSDWIVLIISFVEKHVLPLALGLIAFVLSYHFFGEWKEFQHPKMFWIILVLCLAVALSVSVITGKFIKAIINAKNDRKYRRWRQLNSQKEWEEEVIGQFLSLPETIKGQLKECQETESEFCSYGHDLTIERLHRLKAVTIVGNCPFGLLFVLTRDGIQTIQKRIRDLY